MTARSAATRRLEAVLGAVGCRGSVHVRDLDRGTELGLREDAPIVLASMFKLPLLVALLRASDGGELDLCAPVELRDRTSGPTGLAAMQDPATMSVRDLARSMMAVSDNAAADALLGLVGLARVQATLAALDLRETVVLQDCADLQRLLLEDATARDAAQLAARLHEDRELITRLRVRDPSRTNRSTARELTRLLELIWADQAASPHACRLARTMMASQVWPHRLAAGFPGDDWAVASKTGTLPGVRADAGVIEGPPGRYAVAVVTITDAPASSAPQIDGVIGTLARISVDALAP